MPHIEIKYSDNIEADFKEIFKRIDNSINEIDSSAGKCCARAYPTNTYQVEHIIINLYLLPKPYRDDAFSNKIIKTVQQTAASYLPPSAQLAVELYYVSQYYKRELVSDILNQ